ncbi:MAG TPA: LysM peptidoglycan-binding domain-containing protein [Opitutales bacterium]|jgi:LysM repeat protein|nr:LysM peptidoglycan-binding domain-containing protein [Opitutales bacterium]
MNTQQKKFLAIAAVVSLHIAVITLMLAQHGCKSGMQKSSAPDAIAPTQAPALMPTPAPAPSPLAADEAGFAPPTAPAPVVPMPVLTPTPVAPSPEPLTSVTVVNTPPPVVVTPPAAPNVTYVVSAGDSFSSIARKNGVTQNELLAANPKITNPNMLQPKMVLVIPAHAAATAPAAATDATVDANSYKVVSGDTVGKIAAKNGVKAADIMKLNNLTDTTAKNIHPGQVLKMPAAGTSSASPTTSTASIPTASTPATPDVSAGADYKVLPGDSVSKIAAKYGVKVADIEKLNNLTDTTAKNIRAGQTLKLPASASASTPAPSPQGNVAPMNVTPMNVTPTPSVTPTTVLPMPSSTTGTAPPMTSVTPAS